MIGMYLKEFLDELKEMREQSLMNSRDLLEQAHYIYLKWFFWSAVFSSSFDQNDWRSYTVDFYWESARIMESSLLLAIHGEYKPAVQILRDLLEGMVAGIYFDLYLKEGKRWQKGELINFGKSIKAIAKKNVIDDTLRKHIGRFWGDLSEYVHQKEEILDSVRSGRLFATYKGEVLQIWVDFLKRTFKICNSLMVCRFPKLRQAKEAKAIMG